MEGSNTVYIITRGNPLFKMVKEGHSERDLMHVISYILYRNGYVSRGYRVVTGANDIVRYIDALGHPILMREILPRFVTDSMSEYVVRSVINDDERINTVMYELSGRIKISFLYTQQVLTDIYRNVSDLSLTITKARPPTLESLAST